MSFGGCIVQNDFKIFDCLLSVGNFQSSKLNLLCFFQGFKILSNF